MFLREGEVYAQRIIYLSTKKIYRKNTRLKCGYFGGSSKLGRTWNGVKLAI